MTCSKIIFIIGFIGSDRLSLGKQKASLLACPLLDMDREIERRTGKTIRRLCMTLGEHEYRNQEYQLLQEILNGSFSFPPGEDAADNRTNETDRDSLVVICGDGILLDDMNLEALRDHFARDPEGVVLVEDPLPILWKRAKMDPNLPYAFLYFPENRKKADDSAENLQYKRFQALYENRKLLYNQFRL